MNSNKLFANILKRFHIFLICKLANLPPLCRVKTLQVVPFGPLTK